MPVHGFLVRRGANRQIRQPSARRDKNAKKFVCAGCIRVYNCVVSITQTRKSAPAAFVARRGACAGMVRHAAARTMRDVVDMPWNQPYFIKEYRWNPVPGRSRRCRALPVRTVSGATCYR
jgi:hypothetical protein